MHCGRRARRATDDSIDPWRAGRPRSTRHAGRSLRSAGPPNGRDGLDGRDGRRAVHAPARGSPLPRDARRPRAPAAVARTPAIRVARPPRSVHSARDCARSPIDPTLDFRMPRRLRGGCLGASGAHRRGRNRRGADWFDRRRRLARRRRAGGPACRGNRRGDDWFGRSRRHRASRKDILRHPHRPRDPGDRRVRAGGALRLSRRPRDPRLFRVDAFDDFGHAAIVAAGRLHRRLARGRTPPAGAAARGGRRRRQPRRTLRMTPSLRRSA